MAFAGIEGAGPNLNPTSFANAMFHIRITSDSPTMPTFYYSPNDYGGIKDAEIVWWDPKGIGPDGKPGTFESVDAAKKHEKAIQYFKHG